MKNDPVADVARVSTTVVVVPMDSVEDEVAEAAVDLAMSILALDPSVTTDEVATTMEAVAVEADTTVALPLPSAQDPDCQTSTSCATSPLSLESS